MAVIYEKFTSIFIGILIYIADITIYRLEQNQGTFLYLWIIFTDIDETAISLLYFFYVMM